MIMIKRSMGVKYKTAMGPVGARKGSIRRRRQKLPRWKFYVDTHVKSSITNIDPVRTA